MKNSENFANISLKLHLLDESHLSWVKSLMNIWNQSQWDQFEKYCSQQIILVRTANILKQMEWNFVSKSFLKKAEDEKTRIDQTLVVINELSNFLNSHSISYLISKSFNHFPDMGHDIDLLLEDQTYNTDNLLKEKFNLVLSQNSLTNMVAGKKGYLIHQKYDLEIHHGRLGLVGEHYQYAKIFLQNKVEYHQHGVKTFIPSDNDQLLFICLQRIYSHRSLRVSDILKAIQLIKQENTDWDLVKQTSHKIGIKPGFDFFLSYINSIYGSVTNKTLLKNPEKMKIKKINANNYLKQNSYVIPLFPKLAVIYFKKILMDILTHQFKSLRQLFLIPFLAVSNTFRNFANQIK